MELTNTFDVSVPVDTAWAVLTDVERIAPCLPGAQLQEIEGDEYRGVVKVKVGPITAQYKGKAVVVESDSDTVRETLRESLRLRPQVLRRLGWHYVRVHAFDLYSDPARVAARIAAILGAPPETPTADTVTQPIDVLD